MKNSAPASDPSFIDKMARWRDINLAASVDQADVWHSVEENSRWNYAYLFYIVTSAAIAIFGLLQNSPAVIIGAMLVAPLMGPIMGMGFSLATFDFRGVKRAGKAVAYGALIAVVFTALIVLASPIKTLTSELAARTQPNLLDLGVALFSGLAGAYATIRKKGETIVGVAIATALMPPLATVGFGLATRNLPVAGGAFLLFMTNFMTIAFTTTIMARLFGFAHHLSVKQTRLQTFGIIAMFTLLAVPLALTLSNLAWETRMTADISRLVEEAYQGRADIDELRVNYDGDPIDVHAVVIAPSLLDEDKLGALQRRIEAVCGSKARVELTQLRAESSAAMLEREKLRALANNAVNEQAQADALARWAAEKIGVRRDALMIDAERRRVEIAVAQRNEDPFDWPQLMQMERDVEAAFPGWTVRIKPPLIEPAAPVTRDGTLDPEAAMQMGWASARLGRPLLVARNSADAADAVIAIRIAGGNAELVDGDIAYRWGEVR